MKQRTYYTVLSIGAGLGLLASFLETLEYQILLKNAHTALACNLNSVFSCSPVLQAWQSKVFGFPNSMMCMVFFTLLLGIGLNGLGGVVSKWLRLFGQGFALFFLCFGSWFLEQSVFSIRALCILCVFCFAGLLAINFSLLRLNVDDLPFRKTLKSAIAHGADLFAWLAYALIIAGVMIVKFWR